MKTGVRISDAMTTKPVTTSKTTTIMDCARLMKKYDIGSILVQEGDELIGIVTEYDLTRKVVAEGVSYDDSIEDVMETTIVTIEHDKDLLDAVEIMKSNEIRHLPVLQEDKFVGLITMKDVLKIQPELFEIVVEKFQLREEERKLDLI